MIADTTRARAPWCESVVEPFESRATWVDGGKIEATTILCEKYCDSEFRGF